MVKERRERERQWQQTGSTAEQLVRQLNGLTRREDEDAKEDHPAALSKAERRQREQRRKAQQLAAGLRHESGSKKRKPDDERSAEAERRRRKKQQRLQREQEQQQPQRRQPHRQQPLPSSPAVREEDEETEEEEMLEGKYAEAEDAKSSEPVQQADDRKGQVEAEDASASLSPPSAELLPPAAKEGQDEDDEDEEEWIHSTDAAVRQRIIREIREGWTEKGDPCAVCMAWWSYDDEEKGSTDEIVICDGCELCVHEVAHCCTALQVLLRH